MITREERNAVNDDRTIECDKIDLFRLQDEYNRAVEKAKAAKNIREKAKWWAIAAVASSELQKFES